MQISALSHASAVDYPAARGIDIGQSITIY